MSARTETQNSVNGTPSGPISQVPNSFNPLTILIQHRWQLLACLLIVGAIASVATFFRKPKYQSIAQVQIRVQPENNQAGLFSHLTGGADYFTTQCELLQSQHVLKLAASKLSDNGVIWADNQVQAVESLREQMEIRPVSGSKLIDIVGISKTGTEAAQIANCITQSFVESSNESWKTGRQRIIQQIHRQIVSYEEQEKSLEDEIHQFRKDYLLTDTDQRLSTVLAGIAQLEKQIHDSEFQQLALQTKIQQIRDLVDSPLSTVPLEDVLPEAQADKRLNALRQELYQLQETEKQLAREYLPGHRALQNTRSQIAGLQEQLRERLKQILVASHDNTIQEYNALIQRNETLEQILGEKKELGVQVRKWHQDYENMQADLNMIRQFRQQSMAQLRQFNLDQEMIGNPVVIVDAASSTNKPVGMSNVNRATSIFIMGILLSVVFILVMDRSSGASGYTWQQPSPVPFAMSGRRWTDGSGMFWSHPDTGEVQHSPAEMKEKQRRQEPSPAPCSPVVGQVQTIELGGVSQDDRAFSARCQIVQLDQGSRSAGDFRQLTASLLGRFGRVKNSVVITSENSKSGKTTCACNLALSLAQAGRRVLLVDADTQSAALERVFDLHGDPIEIESILSGADQLEDSVQATDTDHLSILSCSDPNKMDSERLSKFNDILTHQFDWVIYDTKPFHCQLTGDLLQAVGKVICIYTDPSPGAQQEALRRIERFGVQVIGCIRNAPMACKTAST